MAGRLRTMLRFVRVMLDYRWAAVSFFLRWLEIVPGFKRSVVYLQDRYEVKQQLKKNRQSIGHALGDRTIVCTLMGRQLLRLRLAEGVQATADQFFLNRPIDDAKHMIALACQHIEIRVGDLVFDPGCGAGRHLFHFVDGYGCRAIGVDVYRPAIEVAETANWDHRVRFHAQSSLEPGFLDTVLPDGCDLVFINSWLNHVKDYPGYHEFADRIVGKCRFLLVITSVKDRLEDLFKAPDILAHEVRDATQYALLRGGRGQSQSS
ncbi:MAG TPA: class I SAM-dependent methyltransferase [Rhodocyclaceae bacterium]|nr:class I SAM-dependent methyltransferase [Rhodocyclaceae bacterium]